MLLNCDLFYSLSLLITSCKFWKDFSSSLYLLIHFNEVCCFWSEKEASESTVTCYFNFRCDNLIYLPYFDLTGISCMPCWNSPPTSTYPSFLGKEFLRSKFLASMWQERKKKTPKTRLRAGKIDFYFFHFFYLSHHLQSPWKCSS